MVNNNILKEINDNSSINNQNIYNKNNINLIENLNKLKINTAKVDNYVKRLFEKVNNITTIINNNSN